jgi:hypothetical protein
MKLIAIAVLLLAVLWLPAVAPAGQNPDVKLAIHLVASTAELTCSDLKPATAADINPSVTAAELSAASSFCYLVFVAYDFEELAAVEFCATGLPLEVFVIGSGWCPDGALSIGDPWTGGVAVAFPGCIESSYEGEVVVIGYYRTLWISASGSLPAEITYCPSNLHYPGDPHNYVTDCSMEEDRVVHEYPCVIGGEVTPTVELVSPNGGELMTGGQVHEVTWYSFGLSAVKLEFTTNAADSAPVWSGIDTPVSTQNFTLNTYTWTIPNVHSTACRVRVSDLDGHPSDDSNGDFEIRGNVEVTAPDGGEAYVVGSEQDVTWTSAGIDSVKIEYGDGLGSWNVVVPSTPAAPGSYAWTVPDDEGQWYVRICSVAGAPCDTSDSDFTIRRPLVWQVPTDAPTIQAGIDSALARDTVQVTCGTYYEHNIAMKSGVYLRSETGEPDCVTINGSQAGPVIRCDGVDSTATIEGLTITGGYYDPGGGITCTQSSFRIIRCIIKNNIASASKAGPPLSSDSGGRPEGPTAVVPGSGGGMACRYSSPVITDCIISGNSANIDGGGISCYGSSPRVIGCTVTGNQGGDEGGGFSCHGGTSLTVENTIITSSIRGEAISCDGTSSAVLTCSNVWHNAWGDWVGCIAGQQDANGNISENPWFCDAAGGDYHLRANSPCASAGSPPGCDLIGALDAACGSLVVDLETTLFTIPDSGYMDQPIPLTWMAINSGADTVPGPWYDGIYLSEDPVVGDDELVVEYLHAGDLGSGNTYQVTDSVVLPPRPEGDYWLIAIVDSRNHLYEDGGEDNNETVSGHAIHLTFERKTWYVDVDGTPGVDCDCTRIGACLDSSAYADTVIVAHGTYEEYGINMRSGVTLRSEARRADWVTIDATNAVQQLVMSCVSCDSTTVVEGFTMINGSKLYDAGGVYCNDADVQFVSCVIADNTCTQRGGGMYCANCSPRLTNCTLYGNLAGSAQGGGIYCENASPMLENTIIAFSAAGEAVGCDEHSSPVLTCCDVYGNAGGDWIGCIADQESINGNFLADPLFCDAGGGDFHLDPASPCADDPECGLVGASGVGCDLADVGHADIGAPTKLYLGPAVPSPFSGRTEIVYRIPVGSRSSRVVVNVYDTLGRKVRNLVDADLRPGAYVAAWDGRDHTGARVASGIYFYRLRWNGSNVTRRMLLLR